MDDQDHRSRFLARLDTAEAVAITIYLAMLAVVAVAVIAALAYLVLHPPASFGTQGEWFYIGVGFLLVIGWVIAQASRLLRRLQRPPTADLDLRKLASAIRVKDDSTISFEWNPSQDPERPGGQGETSTFNFRIPVKSQTFKLDHSMLAEARTARRFGKSWEEIAKQVNPEYELLGEYEKSLYQRALQMAVDSPD